MHEIVTEIDLPADAARVWAVLTDFAAYRAWNPSIRSIDGILAEGARLHLHLRPEALRQSSKGPFGALTAFAFRSSLARRLRPRRAGTAGRILRAVARALHGLRQVHRPVPDGLPVACGRPGLSALSAAARSVTEAAKRLGVSRPCRASPGREAT